MSDYFAALAARTLQPELGVQPRQRVRWEDVPESWSCPDCGAMKSDFEMVEL